MAAQDYLAFIAVIDDHADKRRQEYDRQGEGDREFAVSGHLSGRHDSDQGHDYHVGQAVAELGNRVRQADEEHAALFQKIEHGVV